MSDNSTKQMAFLVQNDELATMITVNSGLKCNVLSRYSGTGANDAVPLSEEALGSLQNERFMQALGVIAQPDLRISAMKGGSAFAIEPLTVYVKASPDGLKIAAVLFGGDNTIVAFFNGIDPFTEWWTELFGAKIESDTPLANFLPGSLKIGEFILMLHLIDSFKRVHMESMLLYKPIKEYMIEAEEFFSSLRVSTRSGDIRWLLPAFFALTPGLSGLKLDIEPKMLETAKKLEYISMLEQKNNALLKFIFLNTGSIVGSEFANTWMYGVGWNAAIVRNGSVVEVSQKFLAPTSLANHLFTVNKGSDGSLTVNHDAFTFNELKQNFREWMSEMTAELSPDTPVPVSAKSAPPEPPQAKTVSPEQAAQLKIFCSQCGTALPGKAKFCSNCGNVMNN